MVAQGLVNRPTDDLDGFIHSVDDFHQIAENAQAIMRNAGYELTKIDPNGEELQTWLVRKITSPDNIEK